MYVLLSVVRHFQSIRGTSQIACHLFESRHFAHSHFCCLTNPRDSKKETPIYPKSKQIQPKHDEERDVVSILFCFLTIDKFSVLFCIFFVL